MNTRERYEQTLKGSNFDHPARVPILMQFAAEYIGKTYGELASDHRVLVEANLRCAEHFGMDQVSCISDPYRETAAFGAEILFPDHQVPICVKPPFTDPRDAESRPVPDPFAHERMRDRINAVRLYRERIGDSYSVLGWVEGPAALACDLLGMSEFLMELMEDPDACAPLLRLCTETSLAFAQAQIEAGADTIGIGDAVCSQMSGSMHAKDIFSHQQRLLQGIRDAGARTRLHICGQTAHLWERLRRLPLDIFDCDHMVDLRNATETFPESTLLAGNHDPVSLLRFGTPEQIREHTQHCLEAAGKRLLINAGCEIPSGTPPANLLALCQP